MDLNIVIDVLGKSIGKRFILLKQNLPNTKFPLFAKYRLELYDKVGKEVNKILEYEDGYRKDNPNAIQDIEKQFLEMVFNKYVQELRD